MTFNKAEYIKEYMKTYREENRDTVLKAQKAWRDKNKEHNKLYMREYRARKKAEQGQAGSDN